MAKKLLPIIVLLGMVLPLNSALAVQDVVVSEEVDVFITDIGEVLKLKPTTIDQLEMTNSAVIITMSAGGSAVTITSLSRYRFTVTGITDPGTICGATASSLVIPSQASQVAVTVDPSVLCTDDRGGGGGGGGSTSTPTPTPTPTPTLTPSPTVSPTVSPTASPTASPSASPSPSATPSPTPELDLWTLPALSANPTTSEIQAAINVIIHNIQVLQTELLRMLAEEQQGQQPFNQDLFYGLWNNAEVRRLQEFLIARGYLTGTATGNYYTMTVSAVKAYQTAKGIVPVNGRFGPLTRAAANADLGL